MQLPGRLRGSTLGDLLGQLHRARATGVLELVEREGPSAGRTHRIHLEAGLVSRVETPLKVARLGEILEAQGFVGKEALAHLSRRLVRAPGRRVGELLVEDGQLSPQIVGAGLRRQLRLKIDAIFQLPDAELRFRIARPRSADDTGVPLSPREFLHGRPRARERQAERKAAPRGREPGRERARSRAFGVLGLTPGADRADVQRAFRKLASKLHPDRHPSATGREKAELLQRFSELSAAYHLLVA